jgi:L-asparagine oxygenase
VGYRALAELCTSNGIAFGLDMVPPGHGPVCVTIEAGGGDLCRAIEQALADGREVIALIHGQAAVPGGPLAHRIGRPTGPVDGPASARGESGARFTGLRAVRCAEIIERVGRLPVAGRDQVGAGKLSIVGDVGFADDLSIGSAEPLLRRLGWDTTMLDDWRPTVEQNKAFERHVCGRWSPVDGGGELIDEAGIALESMDPTIRQVLDSFREHGGSATLLQGLPIGEIGATPPTPLAPAVKDRISELVLLAAGRALGEPVGYLPEHGGDLVQNVVPVQGAAERQISTSSKTALLFHTEAAFHPHRPRFLLLLCLRGDLAAATTLATLDDICDRLTRHELSVLSEPRFRTRVDESYLGRRSRRFGPPVAVIETGSRPGLCFDADLMRGTDLEATAVLTRLGEVAVAAQQAVYLTAGDLLVVDNRGAVHGRTPFTARFDGTDRWVQRAFVVADLSSIDERDGRVVTTRFR